jgi:hypothetical protein
MIQVENLMAHLKYLKTKDPLVNMIQSGEECSHQEILSLLIVD